MCKRSVTLLDECYVESQTSFTLELQKVVKENDLKICYCKIIACFEKESYMSEWALFDLDLDQLKNFEINAPLKELYFIELEVMFTIINRGDNEVTVFVTLDAGQRLSNIVTESGFTIKLNVSKNAFYQFIHNLCHMIEVM